jgi:hypothetical protein
VRRELQNSRLRMQVGYFLPFGFNDFGKYAGWGANCHEVGFGTPSS